MHKVFDYTAPIYDLITAHDIWRDSVRRMAALLPPDPIALGIDLGCGPGTSTLALAAARPEGAWVAADLSRAMIARAAERIRADPTRPRIAIVAADALALPFRTACADAVAGHSLLYLLPSRERALAEVARVLRPGGSFVFLEPEPTLGAIALARFLAANLLAPRFVVSMVAWRLAGAISGRISAERSCALARAAGFSSARATPTLGGLGYFVVARR